MSDEMTAMDLCDFYVGSQGRESPMANETVRVNYKDFLAIRTQLALAEKQRDAAVEGLEDDIEEIEPAIYILETSPKECLGITGDDSNSWPIRDELISHLKKRVKEDRDTLARIREMGEKGGE